MMFLIDFCMDLYLQILIYIYTCIYIYFFCWTKLNRLSILLTQLPGHKVGGKNEEVQLHRFVQTVFLDSKVANDFVQQIGFTPCFSCDFC